MQGERLRWYQPIIRDLQGNRGLQWQYQLKILKENKTELTAPRIIQFRNYGIESPLIARSLIALSQLHVLPIDSLEVRLQRYQSLRQSHPEILLEEQNKPISTFLQHTQPYQDPTLMSRFSESAKLTGETLRTLGIAAYPDYISFFDTLASLPDPRHMQQALQTIDSFVSFYTISRHVVLNVCEAVTKKFAKRFHNPFVYTARRRAQFKKELSHNDDPEAQWRKITYGQGKLVRRGFMIYLDSVAHFKRDYESLFSLANPRRNQQQNLSKELQKALHAIYIGEIYSGIQFLFQANLEGRLPAQNDRVQERSYSTYREGESEEQPLIEEWVRRVRQQGGRQRNLKAVEDDEARSVVFPTVALGNDMSTLGMCPFFEVGWEHEPFGSGDIPNSLD